MNELLELDDQMPFGNYRGWTVRDVLANDTKYLRWFVANVTNVGMASVVEDALENEALRRELIQR